jgi:putative PIN family toxin of toxin-antitoxin system
MKIVLDTNIFISSFFWGGQPRKILERIIEGIDDLYISSSILLEIESVMSRPKFNLNAESIAYFIQSIEEISHKVIAYGNLTSICRDTNDNKILECAFIANANYVITGDKDLLVLEGYEGTRIVTANEYLKIRE